MDMSLIIEFENALQNQRYTEKHDFFVVFETMTVLRALNEIYYTPLYFTRKSLSSDI